MNTIPVIDIETLDREDTRDLLDSACRDWGFFQVTNHGLESDVIARLHAAMRRFFHQPSPVKKRVARSAENPWGFYDRELTKNTRDWKEIYDYGPGDGFGLKPQWPENMAGFRAAVEDYYRACEGLACRLLSVISVNLGMEPDYLARDFRPAHSSFLRLNFYPVCSKPARPAGTVVATDGHLGINHHTDAGALTLLLQDHQPGLEVYRHGDWHLVEPRRDALVVNIGDIVQVWSNDRYRASLHRVVVNPAGERFSAPFFFNPHYGADYAPLPSTVSASNPARYRSINWGEFRRLRAAGDYADYGDEIQISHYRIDGEAVRCPEAAANQRR